MLRKSRRNVRRNHSNQKKNDFSVKKFSKRLPENYLKQQNNKTTKTQYQQSIMLRKARRNVRRNHSNQKKNDFSVKKFSKRLPENYLKHQNNKTTKNQ